MGKKIFIDGIAVIVTAENAYIESVNKSIKKNGLEAVYDVADFIRSWNKKID